MEYIAYGSTCRNSYVANSLALTSADSLIRSGESPPRIEIQWPPFPAVIRIAEPRSKRLRSDKEADRNAAAFLKAGIEKPPARKTGFTKFEHAPTPTGKIKFLSARDELALIWGWQRRKDYTARDALVRAFRLGIAKVARKYPGRGLEIKDRISLGTVGFLIALDKFDIKRRLRLWTYAKEWVRAEISTATEKNQSIVVRPRRRGKKAEKAPGDFSLNAPAQEGGAEYVDDLFDDYPDHDPRHFNERALSNALESLKPRERAIFRARRLLDKPETLSALATQFQISSERVRQIEVRASAVVSAKMKDAEDRSGQFAKELTSKSFQGRGHKLSYSYGRWPVFRDRTPASNRERLR